MQTAILSLDIRNAMTPDMYIFNQPQPLRELLDYLHQLIISIDPDIHCSTKWGILYYEKRQHLLYINPLQKTTGPAEICFVRAREFEDCKHLLDFKKRKLVGGYTARMLDDVDESELVELIHSALKADELAGDTSPWKKTL